MQQSTRVLTQLPLKVYCMIIIEVHHQMMEALQGSCWTITTQLLQEGLQVAWQSDYHKTRLLGPQALWVSLSTSLYRLLQVAIQVW